MLDPRHRLSIEFCVPWNYVPRAVGLADEILTRWAPIVEKIELISSSKGRFEVVLDGEAVFSKAALGRHAEPGEVVALLESRMGPPIERE